jgi:hypothetical protein
VRILGAIVLSQALLMVTGKPEVLEGSAVGVQLIRRILQTADYSEFDLIESSAELKGSYGA